MSSINYIKSELYKTFISKKTYYMFLGCLCLFLSVLPCFITIPVIAPIHSANNSLLVSNYLNALIPISLIIVVIVFSSSYKNGLFKNDIAYGFKRTDIYHNKILIESILLTLTWFILIAILVISILFRFGTDSLSSFSEIKVFEKTILNSFTYLLIIHSIFFICQNTVVASILGFILPSIFQSVIDYISSDITISFLHCNIHLNELVWCYFISTLFWIGSEVFKRREIK